MQDRPRGRRRLALALAVGLAGCGGDPPAEPEAPERNFWDAMVELTEAFEADPEARVSVEAAELPSDMDGMDADEDGFVDKDEFWAFGEEMAQRPYAGPRDVSQAVSVREGGFPLNVNPEIVAADEVDLGDGDIILGVVVGGEARAYPVNYMWGPLNEVVNDTLGGAHIAPSW